jgi:hypothetical protein
MSQGTRPPAVSTPCATPAARSGDLTAAEIAASLAAADTEDEVACCAAAVIYAGLAFTRPDGRDRLSRLVADARRRVRLDAERLDNARIVAGHGYGGDVDLAYLATFPTA